ncbi:formamidopyrimidine-DNA glycosylase [Myxococcota bacterium]|jgi:formamidopyrimidine-DNA glycosylase|nr:formamidopyrimidine-DNA glycosylase [Myxococcota bacterium]
MPELPDIVAYLEAIDRRLRGHVLQGTRWPSPFVLRTVTPAPQAFVGRALRGTRRLGKRLVLDFGEAGFVVVHLMLAGRLRLLPAGAALPPRLAQAVFDFEDASLVLTEAGTKRRAAVHLVADEAGLAAHDPGGLEVQETDAAGFRAALSSTDHTLKRALTDPRRTSGIGNAYSDEILHAARLSPLRRTRQLSDAEWDRLYAAVGEILTRFTARIRAEVGDGFPEKVTAFRPDMAVHGRAGQPCPTCGAPVQRIVYADGEMNYCAPCQTEGRLLADRALSRLLKDDWPKTLEALETLRATRRA